MAEKNIIIRNLEQSDICDLSTMVERNREAYEKYFIRCLAENESGERITFVALYNGVIAGYVNVLYHSQYPYFLQKNIPEINDLYVASQFRKIGIGRTLISECEKYASGTYEYIGLGVGLYIGYASAQRLYVKMGYIPDGQGLMYQNKEVLPGRNVFVDDDLLHYLYKRIG
jgi:GNAT superfamily N-acetyltransferase